MSVHRQHSLTGKTGRKGDSMLLRHAHIKKALRVTMGKELQSGTVLHGSGDRAELRVLCSLLHQQFAENSGEGFLRRNLRVWHSVRVKSRYTVIVSWVYLCRLITFTLFGHNMQKMGTRPLIDRAQGAFQLLHVVAIHRADVFKAHILKHSGVVHSAAYQRFCADQRFFDVGMAEQHAVTFAAGLASQGMLPVVCIYSTFLQRSYDQIIHDVNLLKENVVFAIDRAGFVPADGETHQGIYDAAFLSQIGIPVYAPSNYEELQYWLHYLLQDTVSGPRAIRYPRGGESAKLAQYPCTKREYDFLYETPGAEILLVSYADELEDILEAANQLNAASQNADVLRLVKLYPFTDKLIDTVSKYKIVLFAEECVAAGGIGEHLAYALQQKGWNGRFLHCAVHTACLPHATVPQIKQCTGLDAADLVQAVRSALTKGENEL